MSFAALEKKYRSYLELEDPHFLRIVYGVILANRLDSEKVWMFIIGASSSGKSEILMSLSSCSEVEMVDSITSKGFVSHYRVPSSQSKPPDQKTSINDPSLLSQLHGKTLIIKDISPISEMHFSERSKLFSDLRSAYDGFFKRRSGSAETSHSVAFGLMAGCTYHFERIRMTESALGERFCHFRPRIKDIRKVVLKSKTHLGQVSDMREKLRESASEFLNGLMIPTEVDFPNDWSKILDFCEFLAQMRTSIARDFRGEISGSTLKSEAPIRISNTLASLYTGLRGLKLNNDEVLDSIQRVIADSCPIDRSLVLYNIIKDPSMTIEDLSNKLGTSIRTINNIIEELRCIRIIRSKTDIPKQTKDIVYDLLYKYPPTDLLMRELNL